MKLKKKKKSVIEHYNSFAEEYDELAKSKEYAWISPDVIFGLTFEYLDKGERLLDIGIGTGLSSINFHNYGLEIYGIDGSEKMLKKCREKNITKILRKVDLGDEKIPFKNKTFDIAIADGLLYFLRDPERIIEEVRRILKDGGIFSFTVEGKKGNENVKYVKIGKDIVSKAVLEKTGVFVYRHDFNKIERMLSKNNFEILKKLNFLAYTSPSTKKEVYFTAMVAKKK